MLRYFSKASRGALQYPIVCRLQGPPQSYEHQFQADITLDRVAILLTSLAFLPNDPSPRVWRQVLLV